MGVGVVLLAAVVALWPGNFSPGEQLISPAAKDIAVSRVDTMYPSSDTLRFDERPEAVYVYLRVEDLPADGDFEARVVRTAKGSAIGRLWGARGLRVVEGSEEPLSVSGGGVSGVVKFAVRPASGKLLPAGDYTVAVYSGAGQGRPVARKYFVVGH